MIRRFLSFLLGLETFEQRLIGRILDQNQALLDRLLWKESIPPVKDVEPERRAEPVSADPLQRQTQNRQAMINQYAYEAASDPDLMEQARVNAQTSDDWREVVERAEAMMERVV